MRITILPLRALPACGARRVLFSALVGLLLVSGNLVSELLLSGSPATGKFSSGSPATGKFLADSLVMKRLLCTNPSGPLLLAGPPSAHAADAPPNTTQTAETRSPIGRAAVTFDHRHQVLATILKTAVVDGRVDYNQVKKQLAALNGYLETLATVPVDQLASFSREQRLAFWIDAYNARVLQMVAQAYPVKSIQDIPGAFTTRTFTLTGQQLTLDKLENDIIRARFQEPRVHFALNCAARSCPPLASEPYVGERLEQQLEAAAGRFVRDSQQNRVDVGLQVVHLSKIFEWFAGDFVPKYEDRKPRPGVSLEQAAVLDFVARYVEGETARALLTTGAPQVRYVDYDWALNAR